MYDVTHENGLCLGFFHYNTFIYFLGHAKGHAAQILLLLIILNGVCGIFPDAHDPFSFYV